MWNPFKKREKKYFDIDQVVEILKSTSAKREEVEKFYEIAMDLQGDGKAVFIGEGTAEEFEEQTKKDKGLWGLFGTKK